MDEQLVDRIYESGFVPELWPAVLDELAQIAEARGGLLFAAKSKVLSWTASASLQRNMAWFAKTDLLTRGQRGSRLCAAHHAGFLTEHDIYADPNKELGSDPFYYEALWPAGLGWGVATAIPLPTGETLYLNLERDRVRGPVESAIVHQLDKLRPHLARSALMSARLQMERARAASEALALIGLPALVLDERGKVLSANHLIEALASYVHWRAHDRVSLKDRAADQLLRDAIVKIDLGSRAGVRSFPARDADADALMVAHVVPIRLSARDIFLHCTAVLVLTPVTLPQAPPVELGQSLFDLTPAEARVARSLASCKTVEEIASDGGVSPNTIRTHVRGVLEKTGCSRQVEVVALLTGIAPLGA